MREQTGLQEAITRHRRDQHPQRHLVRPHHHTLAHDRRPCQPLRRSPRRHAGHPAETPGQRPRCSRPHRTGTTPSSGTPSRAAGASRPTASRRPRGSRPRRQRHRLPDCLGPAHDRRSALSAAPNPVSSALSEHDVCDTLRHDVAAAPTRSHRVASTQDTVEHWSHGRRNPRARPVQQSPGQETGEAYSGAGSAVAHGRSGVSPSDHRFLIWSGDVCSVKWDCRPSFGDIACRGLKIISNSLALLLTRDVRTATINSGTCDLSNSPIKRQV